jgi:hypothetical protein
MRYILLLMLFGICGLLLAQPIKKLDLNKDYPNVKIDNLTNLTFRLSFKKGNMYQISVLQQGIDVKLDLFDNGKKQLIEQDSPNGQNGFESFNFTAIESADYFLTVSRLNEDGNPNQGIISVKIKCYSDKEAAVRREVEFENNKYLQTLDIDHFWIAFDNLTKCNSHIDSIDCIQKTYIDNATDGLINYLDKNGFTAETYISTISHYSKFYSSIRRNTYEVKKTSAIVESVFSKFKDIYSNFKPFKVCFAIGVIKNGGQALDNCVFIGSEITTSTKDADLTEFTNIALKKVLASDEDILQRIKNFVAHECVHTQQKTPIDSNAISCELLYDVMKEGFCDFIGELVSGSQINKVAQDYGNMHEKELWREFKNEICKDSYSNWLYNYATAKDRPADLGYYIGYKIAKEYYQNSIDKKQAIIDIIEMDNPVRFLAISGYDKIMR